VEGEEKQTRLSHASHRSLEISQKARDSHFPTAAITAVVIGTKTKTKAKTKPKAVA
jgi:hypothetical protein